MFTAKDGGKPVVLFFFTPFNLLTYGTVSRPLSPLASHFKSRQRLCKAVVLPSVSLVSPLCLLREADAGDGMPPKTEHEEERLPGPFIIQKKSEKRRVRKG